MKKYKVNNISLTYKNKVVKKGSIVELDELNKKELEYLIKQGYITEMSVDSEEEELLNNQKQVLNDEDEALNNKNQALDNEEGEDGDEGVQDFNERFIEEEQEYLSDEGIMKLSKAKALQYAEEIGLEVNAGIKVDELRQEIINFVGGKDEL